MWVQSIIQVIGLTTVINLLPTSPSFNGVLGMGLSWSREAVPGGQSERSPSPPPSSSGLDQNSNFDPEASPLGLDHQHSGVDKNSLRSQSAPAGNTRPVKTLPTPTHLLSFPPLVYDKIREGLGSSAQDVLTLCCLTSHQAASSFLHPQLQFRDFASQFLDFHPHRLPCGNSGSTCPSDVATGSRHSTSEQSSRAGIRAFRKCLYLSRPLINIMYAYDSCSRTSCSLYSSAKIFPKLAFQKQKHRPSSSHCFLQVLKLVESMPHLQPIPVEMKITAALYIADQGDDDYESVFTGHARSILTNTTLRTALYFTYASGFITRSIERGELQGLPRIEHVLKWNPRIYPIAAQNVIGWLKHWLTENHPNPIIADPDRVILCIETIQRLKRITQSENYRVMYQGDQVNPNRIEEEFYFLMSSTLLDDLGIVDFEGNLHFLVQHGMDINSIAIYREFFERPELVGHLRVLLRHGKALIHHRHFMTDQFCETAESGNVEAFRALLEYGADPNTLCDGSSLLSVIERVPLRADDMVAAYHEFA